MPKMMVRTFQKHSGLEKYEGRSLDLALDRTPVKESGVKSARRRAAVRTACSLRVLASSVLGFLMLLDMELLELELLEDKVTREEDIKLLQQMSLVGLLAEVDDIAVVEHRSSRIHPSPMGLFEHHTDNCHHIYVYKYRLADSAASPRCLRTSSSGASDAASLSHPPDLHP